MTSVRVLFLALLFGIAGCAFPEWRVGQKKVPAALAEVPAAQTEGQRAAAAYIAKRTAPPVLDAPAAVADVHAVAVPLAASLGAPAKAVELEDREAVVRSLAAGLRAKEEQLEKWKAFGRKYAGTPLEGTGIDLAGPAGLFGLFAVVAACVACPALGYAALRVLPVLWGFFRRTTDAIGEFAREHPDAGQELAVKLGDRMDAAHKRLVKARASASRIPKPT